MNERERAELLRAVENGQPPTPGRITAALDLRALCGPDVDRALGGEEPMVDEWESGERIPTREQVRALAELTGFPELFFYQPTLTPISGPGWICKRGRGGSCQPLPGPGGKPDGVQLQLPTDAP